MRFGRFGGRYVPETVVPALMELEEAFNEFINREDMMRELDLLLKKYAGRPTPLYHAKRLSERLGKTVLLKREDLLHTGAHKINNTLGQGLLAKMMGKGRIVAETGAGQHGVAVATVCALFDLECVIYMGEKDIKRQALNVARMKLLGAEVRPVSWGKGTLKEAVSEAIRDWITNVRTTHYLLGSSVGPHPYPTIVREFQSVIGREAREQVLSEFGRLPDFVVACVGGGSNAIGIFHPFFNDDVRFIGVEAYGASSLGRGSEGVLHGTYSFILQDEDGQILETESIAPGLDYPGVGPEHSYYKEIGRACYVSVGDEEALWGVKVLAETEGIIPALEPAHAIAYLPNLPEDSLVIVNLSGRGDKDMEIIRGAMGI